MKKWGRPIPYAFPLTYVPMEASQKVGWRARAYRSLIKVYAYICPRQCMYMALFVSTYAIDKFLRVLQVLYKCIFPEHLTEAANRNSLFRFCSESIETTSTAWTAEWPGPAVAREATNRTTDGYIGRWRGFYPGLVLFRPLYYIGHCRFLGSVTFVVCSSEINFDERTNE